MKKLLTFGIALFITAILTAQNFRYNNFIEFVTQTFDTTLISKESTNNNLIFTKPIKFDFDLNDLDGSFTNFTFMLTYLDYSSGRAVVVNKTYPKEPRLNLVSPNNVVSMIAYADNNDKAQFIFRNSIVTDKINDTDTVTLINTVYQFIDTCIEEIIVDNYVYKFLDTCSTVIYEDSVVIVEPPIINHIQSTEVNDEINPYLDGDYLKMGKQVDKIQVYSMEGKIVREINDYDYVYTYSLSGVFITLIYDKGSIYSYKFIK